MKLSTIVKIAITSSVVLLCAGFALYSFFRLSSTGSQKDFDLYTLVPLSAKVVFVTDDAMKLVLEIDELTCSKNQQYLHVSKLFSSLKQYLYTVLEDAPHGLSRQMNQMMISFHEPDNDRNQVLYCNLGSQDQMLVKRLISKYISSDYPPKTFRYEGEEIVVYSMKDGDFLSCYLTSEFMVLSYQMKLIEEVIETHKTGRSLAKEKAFAGREKNKKSTSIATIHARIKGMIGWTEFEMKLKDNFIYFSGINHASDSCSAFVNVLCGQDSIADFPGKTLPSSTFYFSRQRVMGEPLLLAYTESQQGALKEGDDALGFNEKISSYLIENTERDLVTCLFQREDTLLGTAAVASLSVVDVVESEKAFRSLVGTIPVRDRGEKNSTFCHTSNKTYSVHILPSTTLFAQFLGFDKLLHSVYVVFYQGHMLLAPDVDSLRCYIRKLEAGEVLDGVSAYRSGTNGLSNSYHFMLMADFEPFFHQSEDSMHMIPPFFLHNADFFRHFVFFVQFTCMDRVIYSNVVLKYKSL